jgi:hypothetical protein
MRYLFSFTFIFVLFLTPNLSSAQTVTTTYPYVNPFGEKVAEKPYVSVSHGSNLGSGFSYFGIVGASAEANTKTITYVSFGYGTQLFESVDVNASIADFRSFPGSLHWINTNASISYQSPIGTVGLESDTYFPVNGPFMTLNGLTYQSPEFGPSDRLTVETRIGHVNYGGWQFDTTATIDVGRADVFVRGVYGYDSNFSAGVSVSL